MIGRRIYITGIDGIGKTTQVNRLQARLEEMGGSVRRVWLRFPVLLSAPLLAYARLAGLTRYLFVDGVRVGQWDFSRSVMLRRLFPWFQLLDTIILGGPATRRRLEPATSLLFERFSLDVLVDLMVATSDYDLHRKHVGRRLLALIPQGTRVVILDAPLPVVRLRRHELASDPGLEGRAKAYRLLAKDLGYPMVNADDVADAVEASLKAVVGL